MLTTFENYIEQSIGVSGGFSIEGEFTVHKEKLLKLHDEVGAISRKAE